jgi:hypothetical protein
VNIANCYLSSYIHTANDRPATQQLSRLGSSSPCSQEPAIEHCHVLLLHLLQDAVTRLQLAYVGWGVFCLSACVQTSVSTWLRRNVIMQSPCCLYMFVCTSISTFEPDIRFMRTFVWILCHCVGGHPNPVDLKFLYSVTTTWWTCELLRWGIH